MNSLAQVILLSWGWQRRVLLLAAGAAAGGLVHGPLHLFPILWLSLPVLVWALDGVLDARPGRGWRRLWSAFAQGWWFGFGYFLAGLWWIGSAFLVEAEAFAWALPLGVVVLPAGLALFYGLACAIAAPFWREDASRIAALALGFGLAEWLRTFVFTGFPWNAIGYALTSGEVLMQSASLVGILGLNVVAVLVFAAPATLAPSRTSEQWPALAAISLVALMGLYGVLRLAANDLADVDGVRLRIVQPAIDQAEKWKPANRDAVFRSYLDVSRAPGFEEVTHFIWPESAFPFLLTETPEALGAIDDLLLEGRGLVTGAARLERVGEAERRVYNALYVLDDDARIIEAYDKVHLVPFGEYLPFQKVLERAGFSQLARQRGGFAAGARREALTLPGAGTFSPLICYEVIFSGRVLTSGDRPDLLMNLTNDAWFGTTTGPYQHLHQARVRAVEEGLPLVRAANSGVSAVIDGAGRIIARSPLGERVALDAKLPSPMPPTPFSRYRWLGWLPFVLAVCLLFACRRRSYVYQTELK